MANLGKFCIDIFADITEPLLNTKATLLAVHELLSEGGLLVYAIPNMAHVSVTLDLRAGRFSYAQMGLLNRTHLHFYDRISVHDVFADAGFVIKSEFPTIIITPKRF